MLTVNGGVFKHTNQYAIKNIVLYKSSQWTSCRVKIKKIQYKVILAEDLLNEKPYLIELTKVNNIPSLSCDDMIIYQQASWFDFELEFTMASRASASASETGSSVTGSSVTGSNKPFYEYIIRDIIS